MMYFRGGRRRRSIPMGVPDRREFRASFLSNGDGIVYKDGVLFRTGDPPSLNADGLAPQVKCFVWSCCAGSAGARSRRCPGRTTGECVELTIMATNNDIIDSDARRSHVWIRSMSSRRTGTVTGGTMGGTMGVGRQLQFEEEESR